MCELCKLEKVKKWHHVTPEYMIVECPICEVPMVVLREHSMTPQRDVIESMEHNLMKLANKEYGVGRCRINRAQLHSKDHLHFHVSPI